MCVSYSFQVESLEPIGWSKHLHAFSLCTHLLTEIFLHYTRVTLEILGLRVQKEKSDQKELW